MPIDPRIPLQAFDVQPIDPVANRARLMQLQALGDETKMRQLQMQQAQMQMDEMTRARNQQQQIRQAALGSVVTPQQSYNTGSLSVGGMTLPGHQTTVQGPAQLDRNTFRDKLLAIDPMVADEYSQKFQAEDLARQQALVEFKNKLSTLDENTFKEHQRQNQLGVELAGPLYAMEEQGVNPQQLQEAYNNALVTAHRSGIDVSQFPAKYVPGMGKQIVMAGMTAQQIFNEVQQDKREAMKAPSVQDLGSGPQGPGKYAWNPNTRKFDDFQGKLVKQVPAAVVMGGGRGSTPGTSSDDPKAIAKAIMDGIQPPTLQGLYRYGAPVRAELARKGYNLAAAQNDWTAIQKHLGTMNGQQQERLRQAVSFAYDSLDQIEGLYQQWKKLGGANGIKMFNKAQLAASKQMPGEMGAVAANLEALINDFTSEMGTVYKGGNSSTDETLRLASGNLKAEWNEQTFNMALKQLRTSLGIRRNSYMSSQPVGVRDNSPYLPNGGGNADPMGIRN